MSNVRVVETDKRAMHTEGETSEESEEGMQAFIIFNADLRFAPDLTSA